MTNRFLHLAAPGIRGLKPYQPGKPISELERELGVTNIVKLASNENPLGPSPRALQAMAAAGKDAARYPDANGYALKEALAVRHQLPPACITLGNGSNDVLVLLAECFLGAGVEAVYSRHAFAVYGLAVQATGSVHRIADALPATHAQPYGHDLAAMSALLGPDTRMVFIANPNNPTGTWLESEELEGFLNALPANVLVVVDEAYWEYVREPGYPDTSRWLERFPNLVVTRTFSKAFGLAGLRLGYALSSPDIADLLNRIRQPFNCNCVAQAAVLAALEDHDHLARSVELNATELKRVSSACTGLGLGVSPSVGNFLLLDLGREAAPVFQALLREGVIVRPVDNYELPCHLRVTIGTQAENDRFLDAVAKVTGA